MTGHTVLILGAGFSKPAGGPLLSDLLSESFVSRSVANPEALSALVGLLTEHKEQHNTTTTTVEGLFTEIWREARTGGSLSWNDRIWPADELLTELSKHLAAVCGNIRLRRSSHLWSIYIDFLDAVLRQSRSLKLITFNYDLLQEQLLDDLRVRFDYAVDDVVEFDDDDRRRRLRRSGAQVSILKLHGSANWGICRGCRKASDVDHVTAFETAYVPIRRRGCPWCGERYLESGIIPPILGKAGESRHMTPIWLSARKALKRAREIIVIGYSLPQSDAEALSLFREIEAPWKRPRITVVCGPKGAPASYRQVLERFVDTGQYFEDFAAT